MKKMQELLMLVAVTLPVAAHAGPAGVAGAAGEWRLENAATTAFDTSGNAQNGSISWGSPASWGWQGNGATLVGGNYYQFPASATAINVGTGDFTLAAWVRMNNAGDVKTIFDNGGSTTTGYTFAVQGNQQVQLTMVDPGSGYGTTLTSSVPPVMATNRWQHVAVSVERAPRGRPPIVVQPVPTIRFYIDGQPAGTATPILGNIDNTFNGDITIGGSHFSSYRFNDRLDEVFVYKRMLSASEIGLVMDPHLPTYQPNYWNGTSTVRQNNNCYNYANNKRTDTFAQPGRGAGAQATTMSCAVVRQGAIADGLEPITDINAVSYKDVAALVVAPGYDYHWYRRDQNGFWTHKPGQTNATNLDNSGNTISNPETANRGPYSAFCGYFRVWSDDIQGAGHEHIQ